MLKDLKSQFEVTDSTLAAVLIDSAKARYIYPFVARDCSVSVAAQELKVSKSHMSYWVKKYFNLGLLKVVRYEKNTRTTARVYRTVADRIIISLDILPDNSYGSIMDAYMGHWWEEFKLSLVKSGRKHASDWQMSIYRENKKINTFIRPKNADLEAAKVANYWYKINLSNNNAKAFRAEILDMLERYQNLQEENAKAYMVHLALVERFD